MDVGSDRQEYEQRFDVKKDPVRRNQLGEAEESVCMIPNNPESERRTDDSVVSVAPGEGRRPEGFFKNKDWDVQAFPRLHNPDGSNGLQQEGRTTKLTEQQYFGQRIKNVNTKWSEDFSYICAAAIYLERKQINSNTSMSYTTGRRVNKEGGKIAIEHHDAWSVLRGIKNSPKFWRDKKGEVLATMDNYGPFHWFFTLSCADKRWRACIAAICRNFPEVEDVIYINQGKEESVIKIKIKDKDNEMLLDDFVATIDQSLHEVLRTNVLTVTRYFDHKVKSFIKNIVMGNGNEMGVILFTYRIEFQKRGHPHAHGCLWVDINKMDTKFPGLKSAFNSLRHGHALKQCDNVEDSRLQEVQALVDWIDFFVTCSLNHARVGRLASTIAGEVQWHGHTRRCHKKSDNCG